VFAEDDLLPISALQHLLFCERQCALIHVERLWAENRLTVEGRHLHERPDAGRGENRPGGGRVARGLLLRSLRLGVWGKADVVEFRAVGGGSTQHPELSTQHFVAYPVEYKRGKPKRDGSDLVQLCAQALCLEEMLQAAVPAGAMFYGTTRRRVEVAFDEALRSLTLRTIERLHELVRSGRTPPAQRQKKCDRCSLLHLCMPDALGKQPASRYLGRALGQALAAGAGPVSD
jgi:CRISPR-associated exonuclease Cas4